MQYDIELVLPATNKDKFRARLENFCQYGILNIKNRKVILTILAGTEHIEIPKLPEGVIGRIFNSKSDYHACKVCEYFGQKDKNWDEAKWVAKIDDDSVNDINKMLCQLDERDWRKKHYLCTVISFDMNEVDRGVISLVGRNDILKVNEEYEELGCPHEVEGCIVSNGALMEMSKCKEAIEYFRLRKCFESFHTDQTLAFPCAMAGIKAEKAYFMSYNPDIQIFSMLPGGWLSHIHLIAPDINFGIVDILKGLIEENEKEKKYFNVFYKITRSDNNTSIIRLSHNRIINIIENNGYDEYDENRFEPFVWLISKNNELVLKNKDGAILFSSEKEKDFERGIVIKRIEC